MDNEHTRTLNVGQLRRAIQNLPDEAPILLIMGESPDNITVELVDIVNQDSTRFFKRTDSPEPHLGLFVSVIDTQDEDEQDDAD